MGTSMSEEQVEPYQISCDEFITSLRASWKDVLDIWGNYTEYEKGPVG